MIKVEVQANQPRKGVRDSFKGITDLTNGYYITHQTNSYYITDQTNSYHITEQTNGYYITDQKPVIT